MSEEEKNITPNESFKSMVEEKILERFDRYVTRILEIKDILKGGFKTEQDFKNFFELCNKTEDENDYMCVKADIRSYYSLRQLITYSYK